MFCYISDSWRICNITDFQCLTKYKCKHFIILLIIKTVAFLHKQFENFNVYISYNILYK